MVPDSDGSENWVPSGKTMAFFRRIIAAYQNDGSSAERLNRLRAMPETVVISGQTFKRRALLDGGNEVHKKLAGESSFHFEVVPDYPDEVVLYVAEDTPQTHPSTI